MRCRNLPEDEKQRLVEHRKNCYEIPKVKTGCSFINSTRLLNKIKKLFFTRNIKNFY